jgi:hypothetical protein
VSAAGRIISSIDDLHRILTTLPAAQEVPIDVVRNDRRVELSVLLRWDS